MIIRASDYKDRQALEKAIMRLTGDDHMITGTQAQLRAFGLSHETTVHGVPCETTDMPKRVSVVAQKIPPNRGAMHPFGISKGNRPLTAPPAPKKETTKKHFGKVSKKVSKKKK